MKPTECARFAPTGHDMSKPVPPLSVASYVLPVFDGESVDGESVHGETCVAIHAGTRYTTGPLRFTPAQARALAAALVAHADYVDRVLAAVRAIEEPPKVEAPIASSTADLDFEDRNRPPPTRSVKVGDLVSFAEIPIGATYCATQASDPGRPRFDVGTPRVRTAAGGRVIGGRGVLSARLHADGAVYRIEALA